VGADAASLTESAGQSRLSVTGWTVEKSVHNRAVLSLRSKGCGLKSLYDPRLANEGIEIWTIGF
jgi:hypothetical protein